MKKIICMILACLAVLSFTACAGEGGTDAATTEAGTPEPIKTQTYLTTECESNLKITGRYMIQDKGITCDWTASGIEFTADCEGDVLIDITVSHYNGWYNGDTYFTVLIDGVRSEERLLAKLGKNTLTVASGLPKGNHTIRLIKQSHIAHSLTAVTAITLTGTLGERPADRALYFEFFGDSITCGYGLAASYVAKNPDVNSGDAYYCDGTLTYAALCAEALHADYSAICISGSLLSWTKKTGTSVVKSNYAYINRYRNSTKYAFETARKPDAVIVNLGTNDRGQNVGADVFVADLVTWIGNIRENYGSDQPIVFIVNAMSDGYQDTILSTVSSLGGDENHIYVMKATRNNVGLEYHPDAAAQKATGEQLAAFLREKGIVK